MSLVADVKERILANVPDLAGAVEEAADLAELVRQGALPQKPRAAFVLPLGFDARQADAASGIYRQSIDDVIGVVLVAQTAGDAKAQRALATIDALKDAVLAAVCGWAPVGAIGDFTARRGRLVSVAAGTIIYQLDFALQNQLRLP